MAWDRSGSSPMTYILDLDTMKVAYSQAGVVFGGSRSVYAPGYNLLIRTPFPHNSGEVDLIDMTT
jgi:hypothetical protein